MSLIITNTSTSLDKAQSNQMRGGLDCCVTAEVFENLHPELDPYAQAAYDFSRACNPVAMTMTLRGIRVDEVERQRNIKLLRKEGKTRSKFVEDFAVERRGTGWKWGKASAPPPKQIGTFFTETMGFRQQYNSKGKVSTDKEVLNRMLGAKKYAEAHPLISAVLSLRDGDSQLQVFETGMSPDGRFRSSLNVAMTETARWTSTGDPFGDGGNLFNIDRRLRGMFIPDSGMTMLNADLEQAESRHVAYRSGDENYIEAHESGNVHVVSAKVFWPDFGWSQDDKENKERLKVTPVPWIKQDKAKDGDLPAFTYYDKSKQGQHRLNYMSSPTGLAHSLGCSNLDGEKYYQAYFLRYPRLKDYHAYISEQVHTYAKIITALGRPRQFMGRNWDAATKREAVAHDSQSAIADILNIALCRIWKELDPHDFQCLSQNYDSVLGQFRTGDERTVNRVAALMHIPVPITDITGKVRTMTIPAEVATGPNWRDVG